MKIIEAETWQHEKLKENNQKIRSENIKIEMKMKYHQENNRNKMKERK